MVGRVLAHNAVDGHPGHATEKERHIYVSSKVPWYEIENHRPQLDED